MGKLHTIGMFMYTSIYVLVCILEWIYGWMGACVDDCVKHAWTTTRMDGCMLGDVLTQGQNQTFLVNVIIQEL